jgi:beta-alanine--pyruvate transaminase
MLKKLFKSKVDLKHHAKHQQFYNRAGVSMDQFDAHWMPFSGNREFKKNPRMIVAAEGRYLTAADGRQIFDGLSGLWTTGLGHCRSEISKAISEQTATLDFFSGFQFGHPSHLN